MTPVTSTLWPTCGPRSRPSRGVSAYGETPLVPTVSFDFCLPLLPWSSKSDRTNPDPPPIKQPVIVTTLPLSDLTFVSVLILASSCALAEAARHSAIAQPGMTFHMSSLLHREPDNGLAFMPEEVHVPGQ